MRPETIEELKRLADCNDNVIVEYDNFGVLTIDMQPYYYAYEMPSKIGLYFKQCAPSNILYLIEKLHRYETALKTLAQTEPVAREALK